MDIFISLWRSNRKNNEKNPIKETIEKIQQKKYNRKNTTEKRQMKHKDYKRVKRNKLRVRGRKRIGNAEENTRKIKDLVRQEGREEGRGSISIIQGESRLG